MNPSPSTDFRDLGSFDGNGLRQVLRRYTHEDHVRLNRHRLVAGLTKPCYSMDAYRLLLAAYFHFYREVEAAINAYMTASPIDFDYAVRRKHPWLEQDVKYLGIDPESSKFLPNNMILEKKIGCDEVLVGVLYTIEGATLGGQTISPQLASTLGLSENTGARFFHGYGALTAGYWQQFEAFANELCTTPEQRDAAGVAARDAFREVELLLDDYGSRLHE